MAACGLGAAAAQAEEKDPRTAAAVQDNSFLLEEAYNQEAGVVQHINALRRKDHEWFYAFTQEWPLGSQAHQFSYTVPYSWIRNDDGQRVHGLGDILLNYRPQILYESATSPGFAPRFSLILPTGSKSKGLGDGSYGFQTNWALSKIVSDRVTLHANAGLTTLFDVDGHQPTSYNLGASVIYAVNRNFNLMLENLAEWQQSVTPDGLTAREFTFTVSPGFRYAWNFPELNELQVVFGAALPVSFTRDKPTDYGAFLYLSFEHNFLPKKPK
ncbi:MAG: hypothetical protein QOG83_1457 [Alphaproteobacteria bacterium]|nr:hypothetical protein [Alphaproteobacteria bacterium]